MRLAVYASSQDDKTRMAPLLEALCRRGDKLQIHTLPDRKRTDCDAALLLGSASVLSLGLACLLRAQPYIVLLDEPPPKDILRLWLLRRLLAKAESVQHFDPPSLLKLCDHGWRGDNARLHRGFGVDLTAFPFLPYPQKSRRLLVLGEEDEALCSLLTSLDRQYPDYPLEPFYLTAEQEKDPALRREAYQSAAAVLATAERNAAFLTEAAACGRPLLAPAVGLCRELCREDVNGFCYAPNDADARRDAVKSLLLMPPPFRQVMGVRSREWAEEHFDRRLSLLAAEHELNRLRRRLRKER